MIKISKKSKIIYISLVLAVGTFLNGYLKIPDNIYLAKDSEFSMDVGSFFKVSENSLKASHNDQPIFSEVDNGIEINTSNEGNFSLQVKMFNVIPVKTVDVTVASGRKVIPSGSPVGIKIYADGLLVINVSKVIDENGMEFSPAEEAGIKVGDRIMKVNGESVNFSEDLSRMINKAKGHINLEIKRDTKIINVDINPISVSGEEKKIGIWVRDSTAGVGTMTFFEPETNRFATLGHAIADVDTGDIIIPKNGVITECDIGYTKKSEKGSPGEISGVFGEESIGKVEINSDMGVYGELTNYENLNNMGYMDVASRFQVKVGDAYILADVDGEGVKEYDIKIEKVSKSNRIDNKGMVIRVTDPELLEKTGGIVQGMSGSPIIQNNMLVGAVTHVFINDPERGYGVFIENMIEEVKKAS